MTDTPRDPSSRLSVTGGPGTASRPGPPPTPLATPLGLLLVIPVLVLAASAGAVWLYHAPVRAGIIAQADEWLELKAERSAGGAEEMFAQAAATADGLAGVAATALGGDAELALRTLAAIAAARPGVCQVYVADGGGRMRGATRAASGGWDLLEVEPAAPGQSRRRILPLLRGGGLGPAIQDQVVEYDPRLRPWYLQAVAAGGLAWTEPYVFAQSGSTGVTCARTVALPAGRAVVGVDLDLASLGSAVNRENGPLHHLLFTSDGALIAAPADWLPAGRRGGLTRAADLSAAGQAFFAALGRQAGHREGGFSYLLDDSRWDARIRPVQVPGGPTWRLGQAVPHAALLGQVREASRRAWIGTAAAVAIGILAAAFFARLLARARAETEEQRHRARAAERKAQELGSYHLVRKLGEGGMGQVWLAEHRLLRRPAAIKLISPAALGSPREAEAARARFAQEARTTAMLRCRNTIELYDYGITPEGSFYYVMELLDGCDLQALVKRHGPPPVGRAIHFLVQALGALAEAHDQGLVHRDIKPENLYACRRADEVDVLKVLDFGLVRSGGQRSGAGLTQAGMVQGTPKAMAPEQIQDQALDGRCDLYALGCVACWLLTGEDLFPDGPLMEVLMHHMQDRPVSVGARGRALPPELVAAIDRCVEKDPAARWPDARALAAALEAVPVPADEAWPAAAARRWWAAHLPVQAGPGDDPSTRTVAIDLAGR